jgi:hypothetical protein
MFMTTKKVVSFIYERAQQLGASIQTSAVMGESDWNSCTEIDDTMVFKSTIKEKQDSRGQISTR